MNWFARYGVGAALAVLALVAAVFVPGFFGLENLSTILLHVSVNGILALGLTFVIVTGGIDLSWDRWWVSPACSPPPPSPAPAC